MKILRIRITIIVFLILAGVSGCQSFQEASGLLETHSDSPGLTTRELRTIVDDLVLQYSGRVELAADKIIAQSRDPEIRKNALMWKVNGIASCFQAATRRDPLGSLLDIWILNKQSLALFQSENKQALFGGSQPIAIEMAVQLEFALGNILSRLGDEVPIDEEFATRFATDYPIDSLYFNRASIAEHYTEYIEKITLKNKDLREVVGSLDSQLDQLNTLSAMYAEFLPKQARWQAEILVLDMLDDQSVKSILADASSATQSAEKVANVVSQLPNFLSNERDIVRAVVTEERVATLNSLKQMQVDTLQQFETERIAVLEDVRKEREIVLDTLHAERVEATRDFTDFGTSIVKQIDAATDEKIEAVAKQSKDLADHVVLRMAELCGVLAVALLLLLGLFHGMKRMKKSTNESDPAQVPSFARYEIHGQKSESDNASDDYLRDAA